VSDPEYLTGYPAVGAAAPEFAPPCGLAGPVLKQRFEACHRRSLLPGDRPRSRSWRASAGPRPAAARRGV